MLSALVQPVFMFVHRLKQLHPKNGRLLICSWYLSVFLYHVLKSLLNKTNTCLHWDRLLTKRISAHEEMSEQEEGKVKKKKKKSVHETTRLFYRKS